MSASLAASLGGSNASTDSLQTLTLHMMHSLHSDKLVAKCSVGPLSHTSLERIPQLLIMCHVESPLPSLCASADEWTRPAHEAHAWGWACGHLSIAAVSTLDNHIIMFLA
eukprot:5366437-Amphidinium_carterae.1